MSLAILTKKNNVLKSSNSINIVNTNKINKGVMFGTYAKRKIVCCNKQTIDTSNDIPTVGEIIHKQCIKCSGKVVDSNYSGDKPTLNCCADNNIVKKTDIASITDYLNNIYKQECLDKPDSLLEYDVIYGTDGDDIIYGTDGDDIIYGGYGNDIIYGGYGDDVIYGGYGNDVIYGGYGDDIIYGGYGDDVIYGGYGNDVIYGGYGNDVIF